MAGTTNTGVVNYIANPVARFPANSITIDIFGNVFYRNYAFGAGDDTGVYWNDKKAYSKEAMLFFAITMQKSLRGKFSYGNKLRSSQSFDFEMKLPVRNKKIDFDFMEHFIAELEAERIAELEAYFVTTGLKDYTLTVEEQHLLDDMEQGKIDWGELRIIDVFDVKNSGNILSRDIVENSGETPYLCASSENNGVSSFISYDEQYLDKGNCIFIGGKTFVVTYQEHDFYSNDSHNLILHLKDENERNRLTYLYLASCVDKSLGYQYSWGNSISNRKIQKDYLTLPIKNNAPDYSTMQTLMSAVQKLVIKDVVLYADRKIAATKEVVTS